MSTSFLRSQGWVVALGALALVSGCGGDEETTPSGHGSASASSAATTGSTTASTGSGGTGAGGSGNGGAGGTANPCSGADLAPGDPSFKLDYDGQARDYILHVPVGYLGTKPVPLIMNFHGYTSNAAQQATFSGMNATSDAEGFLVAYPNGIASSWNAGLCCGQAAQDMIDDVGFVRAVVAEISTKACVDAKRIYATGMSNGGFLSHRLGCEAADLFAAIAPVAGVLGIPPADCTPSRPMPVIHFHGTADAIVPYNGGGIGNFPSVPDTFAGWAERDGCTDMASNTLTQGQAHCDTYSACTSGVKVTLCSIEGEGHCWPGQSTCPIGVANTDISADGEMWKFFQDYTLP